jgi:hypothetical protein
VVLWFQAFAFKCNLYRYIRVKRGSDGAVEARRCMVPVVDFMNHACEPPPPAVAAAAASYPGPATKQEMRADAVAWVATRDIAAGEEVTWWGCTR